MPTVTVSKSALGNRTQAVSDSLMGSILNCIEATVFSPILFLPSFHLRTHLLRNARDQSAEERKMSGGQGCQNREERTFCPIAVIFLSVRLRIHAATESLLWKFLPKAASQCRNESLGDCVFDSESWHFRLGTGVCGTGNDQHIRSGETYSPCWSLGEPLASLSST